MSDLISRQTAIKAIDDLPNCYNGYSDTYDKAYIIGVLEELPIIDPVKHGKLIASEETNSGGLIRMVCSECNRVVYATYGLRLGGIQFCPYCGSKMDGGEG